MDACKCVCVVDVVCRKEAEVILHKSCKNRLLQQKHTIAQPVHVSSRAIA